MKKIGKYIIKGLMAMLGALPLKVHYRLGRFAAFLAQKVFRYRVSDVTVNLSRSFPEKDYWEIRVLCDEFYRHFGDLIAEAVWFGGCRNPERLRKQHLVEVVNPEEMARIAEFAPSTMIMYSHCGNWELYGGIQEYNYTDTPLPFREDNFCVVYKEMSSRVWDDIMRDNRFAPLYDRKNFPGYIESKALVRHAYTHKGEKMYYNVNTDQRPYYAGSGNIAVSFMGQDCHTMSASAALAKKFGMAVCFLKMKVVSRGHYSIEYITICDDASTMSVEDIMKKYYELLEAEIREQPFNYLWTHRRWAW